MTKWSNPDEIELVHVPTVHELWGKGLASVVEWTQAKKPAPSKFQLKPEGQEQINRAMATNAARLKEHYGNQGSAGLRSEAAERAERASRPPEPAVEVDDWPF